MLLVHLHKKRLRMAEMEMYVYGMVNEHNGDILNKKLDLYRSAL